MKPIWMKLTTDEKLYECMHTENSQRNEATNTSVAKYARKGRTYCATMSLTNRVMLAMGTQSLGYYTDTGAKFSKFYVLKYHHLSNITCCKRIEKRRGNVSTSPRQKGKRKELSDNTRRWQIRFKSKLKTRNVEKLTVRELLWRLKTPFLYS